jgi:hypothetical protein
LDDPARRGLDVANRRAIAKRHFVPIVDVRDGVMDVDVGSDEVDALLAEEHVA